MVFWKAVVPKIIKVTSVVEIRLPRALFKPKRKIEKIMLEKNVLYFFEKNNTPKS